MRREELAAVEHIEQYLGVRDGQRKGGRVVTGGCNKALAPSGASLASAIRSNGGSWFRLNVLRPKISVPSRGFGNENGIREIVNQAHHDAVSQALDYLSDHAGYTRRQANDRQGKRMIIERLVGISGVKYEHRTSRAGAPHNRTPMP